MKARKNIQISLKEDKVVDLSAQLCSQGVS